MSFVTFVNVFFFISAVCSGSFAAVDERIVNGTTVGYSMDYPFMASLRNLYNYHICGGTIINPRWVLTTAHCLGVLNNFKIRVGSNNLTFGGTYYSVSSFSQHPSYNSLTLAYDAGIVNVATSMIFSTQVAAIGLSSFLPLIGSTVTAAGWGYTTYPSNTLSDQLQALDTTLMLQSACQTAYNSISYTLQETHACTLRPSTGVCLGDGGGPVIYNGNQIGILSMSVLCATGYPDIYTKMETIYGWVESSTP